jgi:hypothetical protein
MPETKQHQVLGPETDVGAPLQSDSTQQLQLALNLAPPAVSIVQHAYRVDWGPAIRPRLHTVTKLKACDCALGQACPSVLKVREYLEAGGERAPDYLDDYWPVVPEQCPICGGPCQAHPLLDFDRHGLGWTCNVGGTLHYWKARLRPIQCAQQALNGQPRWVIPPVIGPDGAVLYHGVTLDDVRNARELAQQTQLRWRAEGYYPLD